MAFRRILAVAVLACCWAAAGLPIGGFAARPLEGTGGAARVDLARQELKEATLEELLGRPDLAAVTELQRRFGEAPDKVDKQRIASVLVRRLEDDGPYWEFLVAQARPALESELPFPYAFDAQGKILPRQYAAQFLRWAGSQGIFPDRAADHALNVAPLDVLVLALTDDPRGREILLKGLAAPNYMVAYRAAWGLARLRDASAVPQIIQVAKAAPADMGELIARALLLFLNSAEAQAAADRLIKDERVRAALRGRAQQELQMNIGEAMDFRNRQ